LLLSFFSQTNLTIERAIKMKRSTKLRVVALLLSASSYSITGQSWYVGAGIGVPYIYPKFRS
jgi:hypothetical protein